MRFEIDALKLDLQNAQTPDAKIGILHEMAWYYAYNESPDQLADCLADAEQILGTDQVALYHSYSQDLLDAYHGVLSGDYLGGLKKALRIRDSYFDTLPNTWKWRIHYLLALIHIYSGNSGDALVAARESYEIATEQGDVLGEFCAMNSIAFTHNYVEQYHKALEHWQTALSLATTLDSAILQWVSLVNLSHVYIMISDLDNADSVTQEALQLADKAADDRQLGYTRARVAHIHIERQEYDQAEMVLTEALSQLPDTAKNWHARMLLVRHMGRVLHLQGHHSASIEILTQILEEAQAMNDQINILEIMEQLAPVYQAANDYQNALRAQQELFKVYKKYVDEKNKRRIASLEVSFNTRQALAEVEKQKELRQQDREYFERLTKLKNEFLHMTTHDLKNPIASQLINIDILRRIGAVVGNPKAEKILQRVEDAAHYMTSLVSDILEVAQLEAGRALKVQKVSFSDLVVDVIEQLETLAVEKGIVLGYDIPPIDLECDSARIQQVLHNLLSNAIKYTQQGGAVQLAADTHETSLTVSIHDSGLGIPETDIPFIFERFYRVDSAAHMQQKGSGLGLSIVKTIVEQHGGKVSVESKIGEGSIFTFTLPLKSISTDSASAIAV